MLTNTLRIYTSCCPFWDRDNLSPLPPFRFHRGSSGDLPKTHPPAGEDQILGLDVRREAAVSAGYYFVKAIVIHGYYNMNDPRSAGIM